MENKQAGVKEIKIAFNPMIDHIGKQLKKQGFKFNKDEVQIFEDNRTAIFQLWIGNILTDKQAEVAKARLFKQIMSHVRKQNKNLKP